MGLSGVPSTPAEELLQLSHDFCQAGVTVGELYTALMTEPKPREGAEIFYSLMLGVVFARSILDGYLLIQTSLFVSMGISTNQQSICHFLQGI